MELSKEITITLKADDKTYKEKFLSYAPISLTDEDATLKELVAQAKSQIKEAPEKIIIKVTFEYF